jgi:hypothetical protein
VIPAVLLPFETDLAIDEANFRKHPRDVAAVEGLSAVTDRRRRLLPAVCAKCWPAFLATSSPT